MMWLVCRHTRKDTYYDVYKEALNAATRLCTWSCNVKIDYLIVTLEMRC